MMISDHCQLPRIDHPDVSAHLEAGNFGDSTSCAWWLSTHGYCIVEMDDPDFSSDCERVIASCSDEVDCQLKNWEQGHDDVPRIQDAWKRHPEVRRLALHPKIINLLRTLYGREPFPFQTLNFAVGSQQAYHSDAVHFHSLPEGFMCGVWIPLADVQPDSGPLIYYPKSHRLPYLTAADLGLTPEQVAAEPHPQRFFEPHWNQMVRQHGLDAREFLPKRGQVLIWHANLLHGGSPVANRMARRWSQVVHYFFADCLYTTPLCSFASSHGGMHFRNPFNIATGKPRLSTDEWQKVSRIAASSGS